LGRTLVCRTFASGESVDVKPSLNVKASERNRVAWSAPVR